MSIHIHQVHTYINDGRIFAKGEKGKKILKQHAENFDFVEAGTVSVSIV
jgi:hypothetical protein